MDHDTKIDIATEALEQVKKQKRNIQRDWLIVKYKAIENLEDQIKCLKSEIEKKDLDELGFVEPSTSQLYNTSISSFIR
jgi:hypothetical protein